MYKHTIKLDLASRISEHLLDPNRTLPHGRQPYIWTIKLDDADLAEVAEMVKDATNYDVRILAQDYSYRWDIVE